MKPRAQLLRLGPGPLCKVLVLLLIGCSAPIKQGQDLSSSGIAYSDALMGLADETTITVVDSSSRDLLRVRRREPREKRGAILEADDARIGAYIVQIGELKSHVTQIKAYFVNLQALSQSDAPDKAGEALKDVSASINRANGVLRDSKRPAFTDVQLQANQKFGTLIVKGVLAEKIKDALERDKTIIGEQLLYEQRMMKQLAMTLQERYTEASEAFRKARVLDPYAAADIAADKPDPELGDAWINDRRTALTAKFQNNLLDKATQAADHMQAIWVDVVTGGSDPGSIRVLLVDIEGITSAMSSFAQSEKARGASK